MIDFASALYLGLRHPAGQLGEYAALTTGYPASLKVAPLAHRLAADAAALQGCEAGMVAPSTLHLAIDVFEQLGRTHTLIADEALYPVMRWGLERVRGLGVPVACFRHGDLADLARRIRLRRRDRPPAVIADATRLAGTPVPLARYVNLVCRHGGLIVIDHSQMLGLMGVSPSPHQPWGSGGGGALHYAGCNSEQPVLLVASWAKAFGAPLATLCGPVALVQAIARDGPTQTHSSAASESALRAGLHALDINRVAGDALRARLWQRTRRLQAGLCWLAHSCLPDLHAPPRDHPLQHVRLATVERTMALHAGLRDAGFRTALLRQLDTRHALAVIVRANHRRADIDALLAAMTRLAPQLPDAAVLARRPSSIPMEEPQHV